MRSPIRHVEYVCSPASKEKREKCHVQEFEKHKQEESTTPTGVNCVALTAVRVGLSISDYHDMSYGSRLFEKRSQLLLVHILWHLYRRVDEDRSRHQYTAETLEARDLHGILVSEIDEHLSL